MRVPVLVALVIASLGTIGCAQAGGPVPFVSPTSTADADEATILQVPDNAPLPFDRPPPEVKPPAAAKPGANEAAANGSTAPTTAKTPDASTAIDCSGANATSTTCYTATQQARSVAR